MTSKARTRSLAIGAAVLTAMAMTAGIAAGRDPDGGLGPAAISVTPSDDLPATAVVQVSGSGFPPLTRIALGECSRLPGTEQWVVSGPQHPVTCKGPGNAPVALTTTDEAGVFGPVPLEVERTFEGTAKGTPVTYTCLAQDDCVVIAAVADLPAPNRLAWHHLSFAP